MNLFIQNASLCLWALLPISLGGFLLVGCSKSEKTYAPLFDQPKNIAFTLSTVPLTQSSRLAGFLPKENRLVLVDSETGEAVWSGTVSPASGMQLPQAVRDGVVLQSDNKLSLFLKTGVQSEHSIEKNYAVLKLQNETQFVASFNDRAEVINLLESVPEHKAVTLRHLQDIFPIDPNGSRLDSKATIYSFYSSALNSVVSLDLMLLKFMRYPARGSEATGSLKFDEEKKELCEASDIDRVRDSLLEARQTSNETKYIVKSGRVAFSFSLDFEQQGVLLRLNDGSLIYLDLEKSCAGEAAIRTLNGTEGTTVKDSAKSMAIALPSKVFAMHENNGELALYDASADPIVKTGAVPDVCGETLLGAKLYGKFLFVLCGTREVFEGFETAQLSSSKLIDVDTKKVVSTFNQFKKMPVSGLGFKGTEPHLSLLGSSSLGRLTNLSLTEGGSEVEVKKDTLLKNILDRL